ncbi:DivIVA domain-containing protein [Nostocoides sp. F2B08]|uniref:DivIVA domain-containing protein n=1 Tax=Nostocoides sp. F2B08 TaxID=2653936 RepID=UPI00186AC8C6|nr:DivIVA domain-containing protein [Tetrasphaera sp. F2B08]
MFWVLVVVVAVALIVGFLAMLAGRLPYDGMAEPVHTTPPVRLPEQPGPDDVAALRFDTALRGYRMDQVDDALSALRRRIAELESEVDRSAVDGGHPGARAVDRPTDIRRG